MFKRALSLTVLLSSLALAQEAGMARPKELDALNDLDGNWTFTASANKPDGGEERSTGRMDSKWVLGRRHLQMSQSMTMMGMKMEGILMLSWDEVNGKYMSTWFDNMTGHAITGRGDMKGSVLTTVSDPIDFGPKMGGKMRVRMVLTKVSKDKFSIAVAGGEGENWMPFIKTEYTRSR